MSAPENKNSHDEQPFVSHLVELRDRLLRCVLAVLVIFLCLFYFANDLYFFLAKPLISSLPQGTGMIATGVISPFLTPFKLTLVVSIFAAIPYLLYQAWAFIAPGLYKNEKRLAFPLIVSSTLLFYLGMLFAYYVVFPLVFGFMASTTPQGVSQAPDISMYLDFVLKMFFAFGVAFEVPIATILVIWSGMTTAQSLAAKRPYIIVGAFVIGMLLTPPDVISQTLLALPMWGLFELGLLFSKMYVKTPSPEEAESEQAEEDADAVATDFGDHNDERESVSSEADMDAELDRIEQQEQQFAEEYQAQDNSPPHPEFEPNPERDSNEESGDKKQ